MSNFQLMNVLDIYTDIAFIFLKTARQEDGEFANHSQQPIVVIGFDMIEASWN